MAKSIFSGRVFFDHLAKTAGLSITDWLQKCLGNGVATGHLEDSYRNLIRRYGGAYSVICAHCWFYGGGLDPRYKHITLLREPLNRTVSLLFFIVNNHEYGHSRELGQVPEWESAKRFIDSEGEDLDPLFRSMISNYYVEHFSSILSFNLRSDDQKLADALIAIEQYDVWGMYEAMPEFLVDVSDLLGLATIQRLPHVNTTTQKIKINNLSPKFQQKLKELNELDIEFYRVMCARYNELRKKKTPKPCRIESDWVPFHQQTEPVQMFVERAKPEFVLISAHCNGNVIEIESGGVLVFELKFSLSVELAQMMIGIHIMDNGERLLFGTNTMLLGKPLLNIGQGTHEIRYYLGANLPKGQYSAGFSFIESKGDVSRELAWYDKLLTFHVTLPQMLTSVGDVRLPFDIDYQKKSETVVSLIKDATGMLHIESVFGDVVVGEAFELHVRLVNGSSETWFNTDFHSVRLTYRWLSQATVPGTCDVEQTPLPVLKVLPGQTVSTRMRVLAPQEPGNYRLVLTLLQDRNCLLDERGFAPAILDIYVLATTATRRYPGADVRLINQVGRREGMVMVTDGREGFLVYGPYAYLPAGRYVVRLEGNFESGAVGVLMDVIAWDKDREITLARQEVSEAEKGGVIVELPYLDIQNPVWDFQVRLWVTTDAHVRVEALCIEPMSTGTNKSVSTQREHAAAIRPEKSTQRQTATSGYPKRREKKKPAAS